MKFILYSLNYSPELTGIGKYNGEMCAELVNKNIEVTAFVAPPYYPEWKIQKSFRKFNYQSSYLEGVKVIRCPLYVPKRVTTVKRVIHLSSFALTSGIAVLSRVFTKTDVIMLVQPTLFCAPFTLLFAKLNGAKTIMHIQDHEVDAIFGLGMVKSRGLAKIAKAVEKWLLNRFDMISTISHSMIENVKLKGVPENKIIYLPNWSDTEFVTPDSCGKALKAEWGFSSTDKVILYAGNIGNKQGLEVVIEAAKYFSNEDNIKFVMVGTGAYVDFLKELANKNQLANVYFKPLQQWKRVPEMLALADIHLVVQKKGVADAVLPSKLTNILSVGGDALVTAEKNTELGRIASKYKGIFTCIEPENAQAFIDGIEKLLSKKTTQYNLIAREYAEQFLDKNKILEQFSAELNNLSHTTNNIEKPFKDS